MDFVYLETKQFNHRNGFIKRGCFFNYTFCIKIIHFGTHMEVKNNKILFNSRFKFAPLLFNNVQYISTKVYCKRSRACVECPATIKFSLKGVFLR